jgi:hypothetical protein
MAIEDNSVSTPAHSGLEARFMLRHTTGITVCHDVSSKEAWEVPSRGPRDPDTVEDEFPASIDTPHRGFYNGLVNKQQVSIIDA